MKRIMELSKRKVQAPARKRQNKDKIHCDSKKPFQVGQLHDTDHGQHSQKAQTTFEAHSRDQDYARKQ